MTCTEVLQALEAYGSPAIRKIYLSHGASEPVAGVKVADLKVLAKRCGRNHELARELFATKHYDARYLACYLVEDDRTTLADLKTWAKQATAPVHTEFVLPWCASESRQGYVIAELWRKSRDERLQSLGWNTWASLVSLRPEHELERPQLEELLTLVAAGRGVGPAWVQQARLHFLLTVGAYDSRLGEIAETLAQSDSWLQPSDWPKTARWPEPTSQIAKAVGPGQPRQKTDYGPLLRIPMAQEVSPQPSWTLDLPDPAATASLGERLGRALAPGAVVGLVGELGAGKTELSRGLAIGLGVSRPEVVTSPTFVLIQEYQGRVPIAHFDTYRLTRLREFLELGPEEYWQGPGVCLLEWADRVTEALPADRLMITLTHTGPTTRRATLQATGPRHAAMLRAAGFTSPTPEDTSPVTPPGSGLPHETPPG